MLRTPSIASLLLALFVPLATANTLDAPAFESPQVGVTGTVRLAAGGASGDGQEVCPQPAFLLESGGTPLTPSAA